MRKQLPWDGVKRLATFRKYIMSDHKELEQILLLGSDVWLLFVGLDCFSNTDFVAIDNPSLSYVKKIDKEKKEHRVLLSMTEKDFTCKWRDELPNIVAEIQYERNKQKVKDSRSEKSIETTFTDGIKKIGGLCFKVTSENHVGLPDRMVIYKGNTYFVELKKLEGKRSEAQVVRHKQFLLQGVEVITLYGAEEVQNYIKALSELKSNQFFKMIQYDAKRIGRPTDWLE